MANKTDFKEVTVCRNDLQHSDKSWHVESNLQQIIYLHCADFLSSHHLHRPTSAHILPPS